MAGGGMFGLSAAAAAVSGEMRVVSPEFTIVCTELNLEFIPIKLQVYSY